MSEPSGSSGRPESATFSTRHELLRLAVEVASEAGELLRPRAGAVAVAETKTSATDIVTAMDTASETLIRERLLAARPDDGFFGEEGGTVTGSSDVTWIVDPLDGTVNYLYGIPSYAVSIAASVSGTIVAGVVVCPPTSETWTGLRGGGAFLGDSPIAVNQVSDLGQALVGTGFWYDPALRARQARLLEAVLPRVRDIRRIGSAAVDLCGVACGRLDAFYETGLHPWDHAAGALIASEAGARVGGPGSAPPDRALTVAAAPGVYDELHALVDGVVSLH